MGVVVDRAFVFGDEIANSSHCLRSGRNRIRGNARIVDLYNQHHLFVVALYADYGF